jgi:hypothetical protein
MGPAVVQGTGFERFDEQTQKESFFTHQARFKSRHDFHCTRVASLASRAAARDVGEDNAAIRIISEPREGRHFSTHQTQ